MTAKVFFSQRFDVESIRTLFERACSAAAVNIKAGDRTAVKVHFGEEGNTRFVPPSSIRPVIEALEAVKAAPFLTDANTLYRGMRVNATDHMEIAARHGFKALGVPIIIADGERGEEETEIEIEKRIFRKVRIAARVAEADAIVPVSHFKGHILCGFGGAIKNLGMGCGSRAGKLEMHSKIRPSIGAGCLACGKCVENCPADAISLEGDQAEIIHERCIGCAECISVCETGAVEVPWAGATSREVQERCAEYAFGALSGKKCVCVTFINNITSDCDCMADSRLIGKDVGIVSSPDPVSCEQAAYDLVVKANGRDIFREATGADGRHILEYSEKIGLGTRDYELVRI
ncbi:MAG TPA: DUF362 domain-containing protein [Syntrophales bacterium]|nr:DUF362 domain-containing protein [Syntrophales bacterium]